MTGSWVDEKREGYRVGCEVEEDSQSADATVVHLLSQRCMGFEYKESDTTSPSRRDQQWQQGSKTM